MAAPTKLAVATSTKTGIPNSLRTGTVISVSLAGVLVSIGGGEVLCGLVGGAGAGVAPGAIVSVFKQGSSWLVQGVISGPGQSVDTPAAPLRSTNAVILPPVVSTNSSAVLTTSGGANLATAITTATGTIFANLSMTSLWPKGHLLQIVANNFTSFATIANFSALMTVHADNNPASVSYGQFINFMPVAGNGNVFHLSAWVLGDGLVHTVGLCCAALTGGGSFTLQRPTGSFWGIFDWGDASGVTAV